MQAIIDKIAALKGVSWKKESSSWFNGHGYFPLRTFTIEYVQNDWQITVIGEFRVNEMVHSVENSDDSYSDIYLWRIEAEIDEAFSNADFDISKATWIERTFVGRPRIIVVSENEELKNRLEQLDALTHWYLTSEHPIENRFMCKSSANRTLIYTNFDTRFNPEEKVLEAISITEVLIGVFER